MSSIPASWDELGNRNHGEIGLDLAKNYLATGEPAEQVFLHEHGTIFEMILIGVEKLVGGDFEIDPSGALLIRHIAIFSFFALSIVLLYSLALDLFESRCASLLASALYALHPRIFHHAFHNSSDIGFMGFSVVWAWTLRRWSRRPNIPWTLGHGLACALAIDTRVVGVFFAGVSVATMAAVTLGKATTSDGRSQRMSRKAALRAWVRSTLALATTTWVFVILLWPFLWGRPIGNLLWAVQQFARFDVPFSIRYLGDFVLSTEVPWHYNLVWFSVTTPWYVTAGFAMGALLAVAQLSRRASRLFAGDGMALAIGLWVVVPVVAPMLLGSTLFNSWRHHFFVYPGAVLVATYGIVCVVRWTGQWIPERSRGAFALAPALLVICHLASILFVLHPYQNLYFSSISRWFGMQEGTQHAFEVDYWCSSYRQGLEYLAQTTEGTIYVTGHWKPLWLNSLWLSESDRKRIVLVRDLREADFMLGVFRRTGPSGYPPGTGLEVYRVDAGNLQVLSVRLLRRPTYKPRPVKSALPEQPRELRALIARTWTHEPVSSR